MAPRPRRSSRSSSPLSEVSSPGRSSSSSSSPILPHLTHSRSRSSSPAINTPPPAFSPSPSLSDLSDPEAATNELEQVQKATCLWGECGAEFYELEPLIEHIHAFHTSPTNAGEGRKATIYACDWIGCPRRGKNQTSKFALVTHLRSHTGEKPYTCPRAECDKSFTRTDALQKHMRVQHREIIVAANKRAAPGEGKKRKGKAGARAASVDSVMEGLDDEISTTHGGPDDEDSATTWTIEQMQLFDEHPDLDRNFVAYVVEKAKYNYAMKEHEGLLGELEALGTREAELGAECEELLRRILRNEVSNDEKDPDNAQSLEQFLTAYNHRPLSPPL